MQHYTYYTSWIKNIHKIYYKEKQKTDEIKLEQKYANSCKNGTSHKIHNFFYRLSKNHCKKNKNHRLGFEIGIYLSDEFLKINWNLTLRSNWSFQGGKVGLKSP